MNEIKEEASVNKQYFTTDHLKSGLKDRAVRGGGITVITRSTDFLLQMAGTVIMARLLSPEDFGLFGMVTAISGFFYLFKDLGLTDATIQSDAINHAQVSTLFWINLTFSFILMTGLWILSPVIAWFYKEPRIVMITIVSSVSFIIAGLATQHNALLRRGMFFSRLAVIEIIATICSTACGILLCIKGAGYWALVFRPLMQSSVLSAGAWITCTWRPGFPVKRSGVRSMIQFGANTMGYYFVNYLARNVDKTLIGWRNGAAELGFYTRAYFLFISPINQLALPLQAVAVTTLTKMKNDPPKYRHYYLRALSILSFVGMPLSTFMAAVSDPMIRFLLGDQWTQTAQIFSILGFSAGIQVLYATQGWVFVSLGRADRWLRWGIIGSVVMVISFIAGIPFGPRGVAVGYTASLYLLVGPALWFAGRPVGLVFSQLLSAVWKYYASSIIAGLVCWYFVIHVTMNSLVSDLLISSCIFTFIYLCSIILFYGSIDPIRQFITLVHHLSPFKK